MRSGLEDQDHREPVRFVHRAYPPAIADPDVRVVLRGARHTAVAVLALPCGLGRDHRIQRLDPQVTFERKARPGNKIGKIKGGFGHEKDPSGVLRPCRPPCGWATTKRPCSRPVSRTTRTAADPG